MQRHCGRRNYVNTKMKNNYKKIFISLGLFLIPFFALPNISYAADINASASRTSGVAPLGVHFNADLTASSETERSFHDLDYSWDFGDTNAGNWGTSGKPKNIDKGPIAAHIYETPGTFTATLTVRDQAGIIIDSETFIIIVNDPDVVFPGAKTTCISTESDFTGCPAGANQIITNDLSVMANYTDAGERVLLRIGDLWNVNSSINFPNNLGPVTIGAFGSCVSPDELEICENGPSITVSEIETFLNLSYKNDWRIMDINFFEANGTSSVIGGVTGIKNNLVLRLKTEGFNVPIGWTHWRYNDTDFIENMTVASSRVENFYLNGFYLGSEKLALLGNVVKDCSVSHVVRVWQSYAGVIAHNIFSGSSLDNSNGRHALKFHGPKYETEMGTFSETGNGGLRRPSAFTTVNNNIFGTSGPWPVYIGPQDSGSDERLYDIIFEKNKIIADYGNLSPMPVQISLILSGRYMTARNNILDGSRSANGYTGISINRRGLEWSPVGNRVYNNTIYNPETNSNGATGLFVGADAGNTELGNNLVSFLATVGPKRLIVDNSSDAIVSNNVLTDNPYFLDSSNRDPLMRNFFLTPDSIEAINQGYSVPLLDDFSGNLRTVPYDIGSFEYDFRDITAPNSPSGLTVI